METVVPELSPYDVVKIYEKHGQKISVDEARSILNFMDNMIKLVERQFKQDENGRFIYQGKH